MSLSKTRTSAKVMVMKRQEVNGWKAMSMCNTCVKCFQAIENVRAHVRTDEDGISDVLDDASKKLNLFMGHVIRCNVQNEEIDDAYRAMLKAPAGYFAVLTND